MKPNATFSRFVLLASLCAAATPARDASALDWPDGAARTEQDLASPDPARRRDAIRRITHSSKATAAPLVRKALGDADSDVRVQAAEAAAALHLRDVEDLLYPWFGEREAQIKIAAIRYFRALPSPKATPHLARALSDTDVLVRALAAEALSVHPPAEAVPALVAKLDDASIQVRMEVVRALGQIGDSRGTLPLVGKVQDSAPEVRAKVAHALSELGDPRAHGALTLMLRDPNSEVRGEALRAIGLLKVTGSESSVAALFSDRDATVRENVLKTLSLLGTKNAVRLLVNRLGSTDDSGGALEATPVRTALASAGPEAIPAVAAIVERGDGSTRTTSAAWVLGTPAAKSYAPQVIAALRRGGVAPDVALATLGRMKARAQLPVVLEYLADSNPRVREEARRAASALLDPAQHDGRAVDPISLALADVRFDAAERAELLDLLGLTGSPRATSILSQFVGAKDAALRLASVRALGHVGNGGADEVLGKLLTTEDRPTQIAAFDALGESGGAGAVAALTRVLQSDQEIDRIAALAALGAVGSRLPDERIVGAANAMLENAAGPERDAVLEVLGRTATRSAQAALEGVLASGTDADRRSIAALLSNFASARGAVLKMLVSGDETTRANAAWALGAVGKLEDVPRLLAATKELSGVAPNAVAAASSILAANGASPARAEEVFCPLVSDARADVQNNALVGLARAHARCGNGEAVRDLVAHAASARLRRVAATALGASLPASVAPAAPAVATAPPGTQGKAAQAAAAPTAAAPPAAAPTSANASDEAGRHALSRCAATDRASEVAESCRVALRGTPAVAATDKTEPAAAAAKIEHVTVYAVGDGAPRAGRPVALALPDLMVRWSRTDRRGAIVEPRAPAGELRLVEPSWR